MHFFPLMTELFKIIILLEHINIEKIFSPHLEKCIFVLSSAAFYKATLKCNTIMLISKFAHTITESKLSLQILKKFLGASLCAQA